MALSSPTPTLPKDAHGVVRGPVQPAHAVGILDQQANTRATTLTATSAHAALKGKWGDYRSCPGAPLARDLVGRERDTLQGSQDRRNIELQVVAFRA